ncbi:DNA-binding response regulator, NarL/FixJ family, contains REC and HTH domains [Lentzea fradiae]|uniref:DNA-binding response regulator, NarL/FixJ family, contains REC and HTH domains n=1 Tax=Lentzea fradiae TaxID=200378 RepID=A0A1G8BEU0_9PSEU|nr:response regulator transcription factor [Lentzea fradiae]SDH31745.1 DNA-binding response regulator, NarL/FixJ family, contains REC and HTH domains [Lentzea fradiae]
MSLQVLICDQLPIVRDGLSTLLGAAPDITVLDCTSSGLQALMLARTRRPDVVITGLALDGMSGVELIRRFTKEFADSGPRVIAFADNGSDEVVRSVLGAGANGLLLTDATREEITVAVRAAARGQTMLAPLVAQRLVDWFNHGGGQTEEPLRAVVTELTPREHQVLVMLAGGKSTGEIARDLAIGITTVRTHVYRLRCKLNVRDRTQLVSFAYRAGLMRSA